MGKKGIYREPFVLFLNLEKYLVITFAFSDLRKVNIKLSTANARVISGRKKMIVCIA